MPLSLSHSLSSLKLTLSTLVSLSQLRSPTHEACRRSECLTGKPMELVADQSACLWILVLSRCQWFFFFFSCCVLVVVVLMVFVAVIVFVSDGRIYYFIGVIILFYCDVYIILLC